MQLTNFISLLSLIVAVTAYPFMANYDKMTEVEKREFTETYRRMAKRSAAEICEWILATMNLGLTDHQPPSTLTLAPRTTVSRVLRSETCSSLPWATQTTSTRTHLPVLSVDPALGKSLPLILVLSLLLHLILC